MQLPESSLIPNGSATIIALICWEFPDVSMGEIEGLCYVDRLQLASAIALWRDLEPEQLAFIPVVY